MGKLKISEDLFLEKQELKRFQQFLVDWGHKTEFLAHTQSFGIVKGQPLISGSRILPQNALKVDTVGSFSNSININPGYAVDKFGRLIALLTSETIDVPANGVWYWVKISYAFTNEEQGTVDIDSNGNMTGSGTLFTDVLRGQPNFPSKIQFTNSVNSNTLEYEVVDVISDTSAVIAGNFNAENSLKYCVVGTFTPGYVPPASDKKIFEYDYITIELVPETPNGSNQAPVKTSDEEFYLARVRATPSSLNVIVEDKRKEFWETKDDYYLNLISRASNPVIGVEHTRWHIETSPRHKNQIFVSWGFRSSNWSIDTTQNKITISSGIGGILKENDLQFFANGFFDGWRIYPKNGVFSRIVSSQKSGTQLNLVLDFLDPDDWSLNEEIHIVPDVENVIISASDDDADGTNRVIERTFDFPVYPSFGTIDVNIVTKDTPYKYNLKYRYKTHTQYTDLLIFPDDTIGHYDEQSFLPNGELKPLLADRNQKPYLSSLTDGFIEIVPSPFNYQSTIDIIFIGDLYGVEYRSISNASTVYDVVVGLNRQYQVFEQPPNVILNDIFINLSKLRNDGTPCVNGNRFVFWIKKFLNLDTDIKVKIVTDYVDPGNFTLIHELTDAEIAFLNEDNFGLRKELAYDGTNWIIDDVHELDTDKIGTIKMFAGPLTGNFNSGGLGIGKWTGWAICDGANSTKNLKRKFIVAADISGAFPEYVQDAQFGSDTVSIGANNLPPHDHAAGTLTLSTNTHAHDVYLNNADPLNPIGPFRYPQNGRGDQIQLADPLSHPNSTPSYSHSHTISGNTGTSIGTNADPFENRPAYYSLIFVQKIV